MTHYHLIGIAGSGLSAIARVLLENGHMVSGSDRQATALTRQLEGAGAQVYSSHAPENVAGADLVIRSSAIPDDHVEVQAARAAGIAVLKRVDFLEELIAGKRCIAVAGAHGKTTTTTMIAWMLSALGLDPSYVIGGVSLNLGGNAHAGQGEWFVIEADEYDRMFLGLRPDLAVVTNVEHDHPDCYPTPESFQQAFQEFIQRVRPDGKALLCADDAGALNLMAAAEGRRVYLYGMSDRATDFQAENLQINAQGGYSFRAMQEGVELAEVHLQVPGQHNIFNALAALAVARLLDLPIRQAALALGQFRGAGRRFEERGQVGGLLLIDDYGHHPTEIRATLQAARARFAGRPLWAVWQPHTFSRTRLLMNEFLNAFEQADHVVITEVYAARETPPEDGFSARLVADRLAVQTPGKDVYFASRLDQAVDILLQNARSGEVIIVLSAGDADWINTQLLQSISQKAG
jgi:UDP-N-acetylmuramate--alanine ligase